MPLNSPLTFHEVTPDRWIDLERLFSARGEPTACWCMTFRDHVPGSTA